MCLKCDGWSDEAILEKSRSDIELHGWGYVHVEGDGGSPCLTYTVGMTRFHGHPELVVTGLDARQATTLLDDLADQIRCGLRLIAGDRLVEHCCDVHRLQLVGVDDPRRLVQAQEIYASAAGLVPALQVVYTDDQGHWPWEPDWAGGTWWQPLLGRPPHP
ncbi:DUF4262 domain-containing protein [Kineosporia sp. NBRC 101731]|uniref:DUF4262 domain-containing protein n=1 Tax=Kineosporia sp. NBRC 101731 TaxID=3032199 RepID=UPI0024A3FA2D|nr:DUF4262 domain-containing protein [Kineosporia sp. NBRC 101731]GLY33609.1 hypothetical protein Kisp02_69740 [Kineosporia sp. NBRC 101731]